MGTGEDEYSSSEGGRERTNEFIRWLSLSSLVSLVIQMLISSENTITDIFRNHGLSANWVSYHTDCHIKINHCNQHLRGRNWDSHHNYKTYTVFDYYTLYHQTK